MESFIDIPESAPSPDWGRYDHQPQDFYDAYNRFIMSSDLKIFSKLLSKIQFIDMTKNLPGDIVELGVFKGSGLFAWLKANALSVVNAKKVYGFDMFNETKLVSTLSGLQKEMMAKLFSNRSFSHEQNDYTVLLSSILKESGFNNFELVPGDVCETIPNFLDRNPGFRASIVNFDLDVDKPTYLALDALWDRIVPGGLAIFDEYAINDWDESNAVDRFFKGRGIMLKSTGFPAPTAYIIKNA